MQDLYICMGELIEYRQTKFTETIKVGKCSNFIKKEKFIPAR